MLPWAHQRGEMLARALTLGTYGVVFLALPFLVMELAHHGASKQRIAWCVAGVFVLVSLPLSATDINNHFRHFEVPELQKYLARIIFLVPVYSLTCWLSLSNENLYTVMEALRSLYEAFVIWSFLYFLMGYLGPTEEYLAAHLESKPPQPHIFPLNLVWRPWAMGHEFLQRCKSGTLQYVVWKILNVVLVLLSMALGVYHDGEWRLDGVYFYSMALTNLSQVIAIYCLVLFYQACKEDLKLIQPLPKFLSIKAVVFFSFWQGMSISALVYLDVIKATPYFSADLYAKGLQDFIICIEMFFFAVVHHYIFSYEDFARFSHAAPFEPSASIDSENFVRALLEAANPRDLVHDIGRDLSRFGSRGSFSGSVCGGDSDDDEELGASAANSRHSVDAGVAAYRSGASAARNSFAAASAAAAQAHLFDDEDMAMDIDDSADSLSDEYSYDDRASAASAASV